MPALKEIFAKPINTDATHADILLTDSEQLGDWNETDHPRHDDGKFKSKQHADAHAVLDSIGVDHSTLDGDAKKSWEMYLRTGNFEAWGEDVAREIGNSHAEAVSEAESKIYDSLETTLHDVHDPLPKSKWTAYLKAADGDPAKAAQLAIGQFNATAGQAIQRFYQAAEPVGEQFAEIGLHERLNARLEKVESAFEKFTEKERDRIATSVNRKVERGASANKVRDYVGSYMVDYESRVLDWVKDNATFGGVIESFFDANAHSRLIEKMPEWEGDDPDAAYKDVYEGEQFGEWKEDLHPRDHGKFSEKAGATGRTEAAAHKKHLDTKSPYFKKWFGESKVVDENGEPLVVYHGTGGDIESFDKKSVRKNFSQSFGFHFSNDPDEAEKYAPDIDAGESEGGNVTPVFLKILNPLIRETGSQNPSMHIDLDLAEIIALIVESRKTSNPYDGVIAVADDGSKNYVVFEPSQIKSALGNTGEYSADDDRINFSAWDSTKHPRGDNRNRGHFAKSRSAAPGSKPRSKPGGSDGKRPRPTKQKKSPTIQERDKRQTAQSRNAPANIISQQKKTDAQREQRKANAPPEPESSSLGEKFSTAIKVINIWPTLTAEVVKQSGAGEKTCKTAMVIATLFDNIVPLIPAGSWAIIATIAVTNPKAPLAAVQSLISKSEKAQELLASARELIGKIRGKRPEQLSHAV